MPIGGISRAQRALSRATIAVAASDPWPIGMEAMEFIQATIPGARIARSSSADSRATMAGGIRAGPTTTCQDGLGNMISHAFLMR